MKPSRLCITALLFACLLLFSSGNVYAMRGIANAPPPGMEPRYGGTVRVALYGDPSSLYPGTSTILQNHIPGGQMFQALTANQLSGDVSPELAQSWEISSDTKTYTFHLVRNATWHDGTKFTAADVKFTFEQILIPFHPSGTANFGNLESIETPDDYTVVMKFKVPWAPLLASTDLMFAAIAPKHIYEGTDILNNAANLKPIGTGPFMFKEYVKGDHITLVKNPNYWKKGQPYLDQIIYKIIPDNAARHLAFENGEIDYIPMFHTTYFDASRLQDSPEAFVSVGNIIQFCTRMVFLKMTDPLTGNAKVREAIAHAIDRAGIVSTTTFNMAEITNTNFASKSWWYSNDAGNKFPKYDPALAEKLLDEAGYPRKANGKRFTVLFRAFTSQDGTKIAELVKDDLTKVGIDVNLQILEEVATLDLVFKQGDFQLAYCGCATTGPDPTLYGKWITAAGIRHIAYTNAMEYNNTKVNEAFALQSQTADREARKEYLATVQEEVVKDLPLIPLSVETAPQISNPQFYNLPAGPLGGRDRFDNVFWVKGTVPVVTTTTAPTSAETVTATVTGPALIAGMEPGAFAALVLVIAIIIAAVGVYTGRKRPR